MANVDLHDLTVNPLREGLGRRKSPDPATIVLLGASGDLTERKLVPALYNLERDGFLPSKFAIVGVARRPKSDAQFREEMLEAVRRHSRRFTEGDPLWEAFAASIFYHTALFEDPAGYAGLVSRLAEIESKLGLSGNRLFYLATAPDHFIGIVEKLDGAGLVRPEEGKWARVVVEKPFGHDLDSARAMNQSFLRVLREDQIFRIDHYLGKETVQNLLAFRFANEIFEPLWNQKFVSHVQLTVAESLGVEGRGGYYDKAGVLRDMVQNHMMQVLSLVAMEPPVAMDAESIRDEKVKVLRGVRRIPPEDVSRHVVRGHYGPGNLLGRDVPGYREEEGVPASSRTETYVALRLE
ncbi:MAG TPA: glucose-6-phosphate dehydrogenase, partial [Planctomycetota bacterium]|nr:glucose-6-phosphate dehydrogenase [Planctomycetota bacterium]